MRPLADETAVLARLAAEGFYVSGNERLLDSLRLLGERAANLRRRYLNSCNHVWATTDHYSSGTEELEDACRGLAARMGLHVYIQGDPRGPAVFVSREPIPENAYSSHGTVIEAAGVRF